MKIPDPGNSHGKQVVLRLLHVPLLPSAILPAPHARPPPGRCPLHQPCEQAEFRPGASLEATQGQISSQSPTDATRFCWHLYGSFL